MDRPAASQNRPAPDESDTGHDLRRDPIRLRPGALPQLGGVGRKALRIGRLQPLLLGAALAVVALVVGATVPIQGVPPFIYFRF